MKDKGKPSGLLAVIGDLRAPKRGGKVSGGDEPEDQEEDTESEPAYDEEASARRAVEAAKKGDARGFLAAFRELHGAVCECGDEGEE